MPRLAVLVALHVVIALLGAVFAPVLAVLSGVSLLVWIALASTHPGWQLYGPATSRGRSESAVALTFDDGPHPDSTPALLDALRAAEARATFFVLVDQAEAHPELVRAIAAEHEIGLHGLGHHPWLTVWSPERGAAELREACARLSELTGTEVRLYRPPFGVTSPRLVEAVALVGLDTIWCSVRTMDGVLGSEDRLVGACRAAGAGDILLLHEGARPAARVLPRVLRELADRGLRSVTVGELL
ncbi:MAG: polysaccharide deacetylase family protein [Proteobacteria bacterium]|nr:polysaccharide deacetylase family protein [Pseudomonadota bacterium]MCP4915622.1 polysaccharide deacetylase family protein [Pseudomonadota bacterium]